MARLHAAATIAATAGATLAAAAGFAAGMALAAVVAHSAMVEKTSLVLWLVFVPAWWLAGAAAAATAFYLSPGERGAACERIAGRACVLLAVAPALVAVLTAPGSDATAFLVTSAAVGLLLAPVTMFGITTARNVLAPPLERTPGRFWEMFGAEIPDGPDA